MLVCSFLELSKNDASIAGGKGASLGEMTQAGIPVPPGFVVLTHAFERFLEEADLNQELDAILDEVKHDQIHSVKHASEKIQALIIAAKMPEDIAREIAAQFRALGAEYVAVRSSATAEDGSAAAWAGQLDTFLNTTEEKLLENVQKCWASLFTPRAIFYRFEKGMHGQNISVAVVVQKMVQSEISGIAFSVHPVTEDYNQLIIEAGFGLGEAIVSGQVTPDSYVVEKEPRHIIDTNISTQSRGLYRGGAEDNEWKDIPEPKASSQVLTNDQVLELADLILKIEKHYGFPCDIEWAFEKGKFYITQSRPITTLSSKEKTNNSAPGKMRAEVTRQYVPLISDLFISAYANKSIYRKIFFTDAYVRTGYFSGKYFYGQDAREFGELMYTRERAEPGFLFRVFENIYQIGENLLSFSEGIRDTNYENVAVAEALQTFNDFTERYKIFALALLGFNIQFPIERELRKQIENRAGASDALAILTFPHKQNIAGLEIENLLRIGVSLRSEKGDSFGALTTHVRDAIAKHIDKFGWINTRGGLGESWTYGEILQRIRDLGPDYEQKLAEIERHKKEMEEKSKTLLKSLGGDPVIVSLVETAKELVYYRTYRTDYLNKIFFNVRNLLTAIAKSRRISFEDLLHLRIDEIKDSTPVDTRELRRRADDYALFTVEPGATLFTSDPVKMREIFDTHCEAESGDANEIKGSTACGGKLKGTVRIVVTKQDMSKVQKGDVMVSPMTTPDMIPAMSLAAGFVTDEGGITCHAAIVSREMKKPCVIGTKIATQVLKDGDIVEVDANDGVVRILKPDQSTVEKIKLVDWYQDWSGLYSQLEASLDADAYFGIFESTAGVHFSQAFLTFKGETAIGWLPTQDSEMIGTHLVKRMKDPKFLQEWVSTYRTNADTLMPFFKLSPEVFLKQFKEYVSLYPLLAPYVIGTKIAFNLLPLDSEKIAAELEAARVYTERFYKDSSVAITNLCQFIASRSGYADNLIRTLTTDEVCTYAETGKLPDKTVLEERASRGGMLFVPGSQQVLSKAEVDEIFATLRAVFSDKELQGTSAYRGNVKGICRVIRDYRNATLDEGEILVTPMTNPYFVPLMKKAAAIVTDGGGMLSHAAIVARELKKPCVIGTKIATQVLKDGDMVQVDAEKGIVRKL